MADFGTFFCHFYFLFFLQKKRIITNKVFVIFMIFPETFIVWPKKRPFLKLFLRQNFGRATFVPKKSQNFCNFWHQINFFYYHISCENKIFTKKNGKFLRVFCTKSVPKSRTHFCKKSKIGKKMNFFNTNTFYYEI